LEEVKQANLELERKDGIKRHFRYDWQEIADYNPDYRAYVEAERERLGENHPLFLTQYRLLPLQGGGGFLSRQQLAQLDGEHGRKRHAQRGQIYIAGIDLAGEAEGDDFDHPQRDSTVVTIGELDFSVCDDIQKQPRIKVVEHYRWTGQKHAELYPRLVDILKSVWKCRRVVVDATGLGQPVSSFLRKALGSRVSAFTFTARAKSQLGFKLLAAINSGRLKVYARDASDESRQFWRELKVAKCHYRPSQTLNFYVSASEGHDDFLMSLALLVEAAERYEPREARGGVRE
jgi:hypothetical protein